MAAYSRTHYNHLGQLKQIVVQLQFYTFDDDGKSKMDTRAIYVPRLVENKIKSWKPDWVKF